MRIFTVSSILFFCLFLSNPGQNISYPTTAIACSIQNIEFSVLKHCGSFNYFTNNSESLKKDRYTALDYPFSDKLDASKSNYYDFKMSVEDENCTNGIDDDGDGLVDYLDPDCQCSEGNIMEHVPNTGFEEHTDCCNSLEEGCVNDWFNILLSPDFYHPDCLTEQEWNKIENDYQVSISNAVINLWGTPNFMESFGVCLKEPLVTSQTYDLSFNFLKKNTNDLNNTSPLTGYIHIYGWKTCASLKNYASSSPLCFDPDTTTNAEIIYTIDLSSFNQAEWQSIQHNFTPAGEIGAISIGINCNDGGIQSSGLPGFLIDNISIKPEGAISTPNFSVELKGNLCKESFSMVTKDSSSFNYQWFKEGVIIADSTSSSFLFDKNAGHTDGLYQVAIITSEGCSLVDSIEIKTGEDVSVELTEKICSGDSLLFEGEWLLDAGDYSKVLQTAKGCDSLRILKLEVRENILKDQHFSMCMNESITFGDSVITKPGQYQISIPGEHSCDTLYSVHVSTHPNSAVKEVVEICEGDSYIHKGEVFSTEGTHYLDYLNEHGCMTKDTIVITFKPSYTISETQMICPGDTFFYKGITPLFKEDLYTFNEKTLKGCDSIVHIQISIFKASNSSENVTICQGETYSYNGSEYSENGVYPITLQSKNGCDSIHTITLEVVDTLKTFELKQLCAGESYTIDGDVLTNSGLYKYHYKSQAGCDSVFTVELAFLDPLTNYEAIEICDNEYFVYNNDTLKTTGEYEYKFTSLMGCDSLHTIALQVYKTHDGFTKEVKINDGEYYIFGGDTLYQEGNYSHVFHTSKRCDSIEYLNLRINKIKNDLYIPNVFSPNNDGVNDKFKIYAARELGMQIVELSIFDRWGNLVFRKKNIEENWQGWDGRFNGVKVLSGVYAYKLIYRDVREREHRKIGKITLLN